MYNFAQLNTILKATKMYPYSCVRIKLSKQKCATVYLALDYCVCVFFFTFSTAEQAKSAKKSWLSKTFKQFSYVSDLSQHFWC